MDNQQPSNRVTSTLDFSTQSMQAAAPKSVAALLDDKGAMNDWVTNIGKIRQKASGGVAKQAG